MSLSVSLLVVAALTALLPIASLWFRPPASIRDLEKTFVVAIATLAIGAFVTSRFHRIGPPTFGFVHLMYLLGVVTVPMLLGGWWLLAFIRRSRTRLLRIGGLVAIVVVLAGVWGTHIEPNWLRTDVVSVTAPVTTAIKVGVLADLQTPNVGKPEWNAINTLLAENPDIVLVPGDYFQGSPLAISAATPDLIALLEALVAEVELVAVVSGDSDWAGQLQPMAEAAGALYIDNRTINVQVAGQPVRIAGVTVADSPAKLSVLADLATPGDGVTILLSHRPDVVFDLPLQTDVDLIVSGHTHGGQIAIPYFGPPVTLSDVPRSIAAGGIGIVDRFPVYVSTGVGLERGAAPQVRFGVRPSVGIINMLPPSATSGGGNG